MFAPDATRRETTPTRSGSRLVLAGLLLLIAGCEDAPEVREYKAPAGAGTRPFSCKVPDNWDIVANDRFSELAFESRDGANGPARVTVSSLSGTGDDFLLMNVNRWRGQIALEPAESLTGLSTLDLVNSTAKTVEFVGSAKALRGAMVEREGKTWFFKLSGTPAAVQDQADEFDAFVKSVEFFETNGNQ